jgi:2-phospho-L-lactate guanylyltransferase
VRTFAILPVKNFPNAKQRLSRGVEPQLRSQLAESMLYDVLGALRLTAVDQVIVVTAGEEVARIAHEHGATVVRDSERGHNAAATCGIERALQMGAGRVLLVPGDCPALDPAELDELVQSGPPQPSVVIVPDRHGTGTNALLITPPDALEPAFGPGSCQRHAALAQAAGIAHTIAPIPSLALDIDTPDDLAALDELPDNRGLRTHALLSRC